MKSGSEKAPKYIYALEQLHYQLITTLERIEKYKLKKNDNKTVLRMGQYKIHKVF